jgi:AcrR family transcriptional regulator
MADVTEPASRSPRADARRNRERLLAAAAELFAERGLDAPLDEVARRAGVGQGTLYRHFPSRNALVEGLIREDNAALCQRGEELVAGPDPVEALTAWLRAYVEHATRFRGLAESLRAAAGRAGEGDPLADCVERVQVIGDALVDRAHQAGRLRAEVSSAEAFDLAAAVAWISEDGRRDLGQRDRLLSLLLDPLFTRE